jgi:hypothetical protein
MKKAVLIAAMLLVSTVPAIAQVPEEEYVCTDMMGDQTEIAQSCEPVPTVHYDNEPGLCLELQADMACPEDAYVLRLADDGKVYDESGTEYVRSCVESDAARLLEGASPVCAWYPVVPSDQIVGEVQ